MSIDNVPYYKITGQYCFKGDLIFIRGGIYFFPRADLEKQREEISNVLRFIPHLHHAELLIGPIVRKCIHLLRPLAIRSVNESGLKELALWQPGDTGETLKPKLDSHITDLKLNHRPDSLPNPACFKLNEVSNLRISRTGTLSFDAQSDRHDFSVGLRRKEMLRKALWECGFMIAPPGN